MSLFIFNYMAIFILVNLAIHLLIEILGENHLMMLFILSLGTFIMGVTQVLVSTPVRNSLQLFLFGICFALFSAGSSLISWGIVTLFKKPDLKARIFREP